MWLAAGGSALSANVGELYWAQGVDDLIRRHDPTSGVVDTVLQWPDLEDAVAVAVDEPDGYLYWAQTFGDRILRAPLTGASPQVLAEWPAIEGVVALVIDPGAGRMYWAQQLLFADRIVRADLDGQNPQVLAEWPDVDGPVALALDATTGDVYWAQSYGDDIRRVDAAGTTVQVVVSWPVVEDAVALAFDSTRSLVVWAQRADQADRILVTDPSGSVVQTVATWPVVDTPVALAVSDDGADVLWAEGTPQGARIRRVDASTGLNPTTLIAWPEIADPVALAIAPPRGCPAVSVAAVGPRYFRITPGAGGDTVAFRVTGDASDPATSCVDAYVQPDGTLGTTPSFQARSAWADVVVGDRLILPSTRYTLSAECQVGAGVAASTPRSITTWRRGDSDNNVTTDFNDIARIVQGFLGDYGTGQPPLTVEMVDYAGFVGDVCRMNRTIDFIDIATGVTAFLEQPDECLTVCP